MSNMRSYASMVSGKEKGKDDQNKDQPPSSHGNQQNGKSSSAAQHESHHQSPKHNHSNSKSSPKAQNASHERSKSPTSRKSGPYSAAEYIRAPRHIPNTRSNRRSPSPNGDTEQHYILTLFTDQALHDYMTSLRTKYFPPKINKLDAHITLFHALPGSKLDQITHDIEALCSHERPFSISAEDPYSPRSNNIMVRATSPRFAIEGVQKVLREKWGEFLSEQDSGGMRPHWTLMNKVQDKDEADRALKECKEEFKRPDGQVKGLVLWRYDKGFWKDQKVFKFEG